MNLKNRVFLLVSLLATVIACSACNIGPSDSATYPETRVENSANAVTEEPSSAPPEEPGILNTCIIIISFDDGNDTDYSVAFPLMEARGIRGVSYINPSMIGEKDKLTWSEIHLLDKAGWDIACHTDTHPRLSELSAKEIRAEMEAVNAAFKANNLDPPIHHAYPFTDYNASVIEALSSERLTARRGEHPDLNFSWQEPVWYELPALRVYIQDQHYFTQVREQIRLAKEQNRLLFLYTHRVTDNPGPYDTETAYFAALLDYIVGEGIKTATISEVYELYNRSLPGGEKAETLLTLF